VLNPMRSIAAPDLPRPPLEAWRQPVYEAVRMDFYARLHSPAGLSVPNRAGGWWHEYGCPRHGVELVYDSASPNAHRCPVDGEILTGEGLDGAWRVFRHNELAELIYSGTALYVTGGDFGAGEAVRKLLLEYAQTYALYDGDRDAPGIVRFLGGKLYRQALSESIWAVRVLSAYHLLRGSNLFSALERRKIEGQLFKPQAQRLLQAHQEQINIRREPYHNYMAWLNAALGIAGFVLEEAELQETALSGRAGFYTYLSRAIQPDGMEYEASYYYHLFSTRACLLLAQVAADYDVNLWVARGTDGQSLEKMLDALLLPVSDAGDLPAIKDGPFEREPYRREWQEVGELAWANTGRADFGWFLAKAYPDKRGNHPAALVYGYGQNELKTQKVRPFEAGGILEQSGIIVLRQPGATLEAQIYCGQHGGAHGHLDKLSLHLPGITPDFGTTPYAMPQHKEYYQQTVSHNTLLLDGSSQEATTGQLYIYEAGADAAVSYVCAGGGQAYTGAELCRSVLLTPEYLLDVFWFERQPDANAPGVAEWLLHPLGVELDFEPEIISNSSSSNYGYVNPPLSFGKRKIWQAALGYVANGSTKVKFMMLDSPADSELLQASAPGPAHRPDILTPLLMVRTQQSSGQFVALYHTLPHAPQIRELKTKERTLELIIEANGKCDQIELAAFSDNWHWQRNQA
jgi:oligo-alginate lyase